MAEPDYDRHRWQLRRARIQDALGIDREGVNVARDRDVFIDVLARRADNPVAEFGRLPERVVDALVSVALAEISESPTDTMSLLLMCVSSLVADGQFARLAVIADRLIAQSAVLDVERPFLASATRGLGLALQGSEGEALRVVDGRLEGGGAGDARPRASLRQRLDLLAAMGVRAGLRGEDEAVVLRIRSIAVKLQDGLLYGVVDAVAGWRSAATRARPERVLRAADPTFQSTALGDYILGRRIPTLFPAQIRAINAGATTDADKVVVLPTSSGKTLLAEMRVAASLARHPGSRVIYVAPYRMLARQVRDTFTQGLKTLGHTVRDLGSGYDPTLGPRALGPGDLPDVAVCTPERLDALMRAAQGQSADGVKATELLDSCRLLIFDELQLVGREGRGPRFEFIVARLRARYPHWQFLGLAAASQGGDELARWLGIGAITGAARPTGTLEIVWETNGDLRQREADRPVKVANIPRGTQPFHDAARLIAHLHEAHHPVLAIEPQRSYTETLARRIAEAAPAASRRWLDSLSEEDNRTLMEVIEDVRSVLGAGHVLGEVLRVGVAVHHAGLPTRVLSHIEMLAKKRLVRVVCATTTVAEGADLPFRTVIIPHLNFSGRTRSLNRDLYLNIIGRAGRAGVSAEGMVFILDTDAASLKDHVRAKLWKTTTSESVRGTISLIAPDVNDVDQWSAFLELQSQVAAWLGEPQAYVEDQARALAERTFSWATGAVREKQIVTALIRRALADLEERGYAVAGSPLTLTGRGRTASLTGLSAPTTARLERVLPEYQDRLFDLTGTVELDDRSATVISRILLESLEVMKDSLWLHAIPAKERRAALMALDIGLEFSARYDSPAYKADVAILAGWITGASYEELALLAPRGGNSRSLFGGEELQRTSDAAEYIGKQTYPAAWAWSGVRVLSNLGSVLPGFIRDAIEIGLPSEAATQLARRASLSRHSAQVIASHGGPRWAQAAAWLATLTDDDIAGLGLTRIDARRAQRLRDTLRDLPA